jgi:H+/Cl- antiporter ClcA
MKAREGAPRPGPDRRYPSHCSITRERYPRVVLGRSVAIVVLVLFGTITGAFITLLLGTEHLVAIHSMSTMDATYGSSTPFTSPPSPLLVGFGAFVGTAVAALLVRRFLRR